MKSFSLFMFKRLSTVQMPCQLNVEHQFFKIKFIPLQLARSHYTLQLRLHI